MFIPLHLYSEYSFLESGVLLENAFKKAKNCSYPAIGVSDKNVLMSFPLFNKLAKKFGVKPVFGMDLSIDDNNYSVIIKNEDGYRNISILSTLLSKGSIDLITLKKHINGLILIVSTSSTLFNNINEDFKNNLAKIANGIPFDDFYIGLEFYSTSMIPHYNLIRNFAQQYSYKLMAFPLIKYIDKKDAIVIDLLKAIREQTKLEKDYITNNTDYFFKTPLEMTKFYLNDELEMTNKLLNTITFEFDKKRGEMLHYPLENNESSEEALKNKIFEGLKYRGIDLKKEPNYRNRLNYEFLTIEKMGYCDYFLIVQDYVNFAKNNNIPVGPGRGSAAGSLVSYLLNITDVDPLKYNLLFERFLNPQRQTMPDIDMDFSDQKRDQVIQYLKNKYGSNRVANIVTIQTIGAKQALRDIGRIHNLSSNDVSLLTKLIVEKNNFQVTLKQAYENFPNFKKEIDNDSNFKLVYDHALLVEGLGRQRGLNAAGILLNNIDLNGAIPLFNDDAGLVTQYEKDYLEDEGFLKMDILGLINLSTIEHCVDLIKQKKNVNVDIKNIDLNDPLIYKLIQNNLTMGLFQLDTSAANNAMKMFKPRNFNELAAFISLDRPGPRNYLPTYANRLNGKEKILYDDPSLIPALEETYGVMIYQEQIMLASQAFAGFTFAEADLLRSACAKKHKSEMDALKAEFITGALAKGHKIQVINKVFDNIARFAEYGFNKSHSIAYSMITAETGFLKAHYPAEFYAAILESNYSKNDLKFSKYVSEIKKSGVKIHLPDINLSSYQFDVIDDELIMPLNSINGLAGRIAINIIEERNNHGPFKDFLDFVIRMTYTPDNISETTISKLIDGGCFDSLFPNRKTLKLSILRAKQNADMRGNIEGRLILDTTLPLTFEYIKADDDPYERIENEYDALGVMLSDSPLNHVKDKIESLNATPINELTENKKSTIVCLFRAVKKITTKNNKTMAFITAYDDLDEIDVTVFSDAYEKYIDLINTLKKKDIIAITGSLKRNYKNNELGFVLDDLKKIEGVN